MGSEMCIRDSLIFVVLVLVVLAFAIALLLLCLLSRFLSGLGLRPVLSQVRVFCTARKSTGLDTAVLVTTCKATTLLVGEARMLKGTANASLTLTVAPITT